MGRKKSATNRIVDSRGYVLLWMPEHRLADVRGYVYEHRIVAENKLGRELKHGEIVHHIDGNTENNTKDNLEICQSIAHHRGKHRKSDSNLRLLGENNPIVNCACGCKKTFRKYDSVNRPRKFASGHNSRIKQHG